MSFDSSSLVSFLIAVSFAAGLNTYATVATLGLLARFHVIVLPPGITGLADTGIIAASVALFLVELFADKIPYFDLLWNAVHTFVRVPVAAFMAYRASAALSPQMQLLVTIAAGLVAAIAHTAKIGARVGVTASPEPLSNIALSTSEDVAAVGLTWAATKHPYSAAAIVAIATLLAILLSRWIYVSLRRQLHALRERWNTRSASPAAQPGIRHEP
jgi:hypothetical protein